MNKKDSPALSGEQKIKVFELDFGDTNLLSENPKEILNWIEADLQGMTDDQELSYTITIRMMTPAELKSLPEWS